MDYIKLLRPAQWSKNLFVFLPLFFAQDIDNLPRLIAVAVTFLALSMASSSIYVLNDMCDVEFDRIHPEKCRRPIASGRVSLPIARLLYACLLLLSILIIAIFIPSTPMFIVLAAYLLINHAYSLWLKHVAILDVMLVAFGFVLRIIAGAVAAEVEPSHWIIIMTFLLALFLVLAKRRDDVIKYERTQAVARRNVTAYNRNLLDHIITLVAAITLVSYIMYTVDDEIVARFDCKYVYATSIFVLAGILRYLQITLVEEKSWSPTKIIMRDRFLQLCVAGWLLLFAYIIYG
ncbi:MAG: UbiA prenyltransferase family protein [Bacteroidaceae bacterium]|nr:UbiA prenyltransferase family protein [Bacteroidaceae bacterium]MBR6757988.1 UbiA prenyltransferase family protein [Bacteroidaceae bacterium]